MRSSRRRPSGRAPLGVGAGTPHEENSSCAVCWAASYRAAPFLLVASLFFYAWGLPWLMTVMVASIAANYFLGLWIDRVRERAHRRVTPSRYRPFCRNKRSCAPKAAVRLVELRYFSGLDVRETADVLGISPTTVKREWAVARAWLKYELER